MDGFTGFYPPVLGQWSTRQGTMEPVIFAQGDLHPKDHQLSQFTLGALYKS